MLAKFNTLISVHVCIYVHSDIPMLRIHVHYKIVPINTQFITLNICFETHLVALLSGLLCIQYTYIFNRKYGKNENPRTKFSRFVFITIYG